MKSRTYSQKEVTRIVSVRLHRERERLVRSFEKRIKRCMASLHLMLYQEMCEMKRDTAIEMQEPLLQDIDLKEGGSLVSNPDKNTKGGKKQ